MNESKPTSGWNEAKPSFPIAMNVGEAMVYASKDKCFWTGEMHTALETLAAEVERLRAEVEILAVEVTRLQAIEHEQIETQAELAATKAASELPVQVIDCYSFGDDVEVVCKCGDDADRLSGWIRDRMKDASPPAT